MLLQRLERLLPNAPAEPDWHTAIAFRWRGTAINQSACAHRSSQNIEAGRYPMHRSAKDHH
ncbi:MAG TPA: hypothetical protein VLU73_05290 [Methylococcaceae bacterium]|nr:hypothetical protein [Methylococcaceae bacterium]